MGNQIYHRGHREHGGKTNTLHHEGHEVNEVKQVSPMATNASPLDHARRAAGGMQGKQCFVCMGNPDSSGFPLASLLPNFF